MSVEEMIQKNNDLREELTDENKAYYEKILLYVRFKGLFSDDEVLETLLLNILYDILDAQQAGTSAERYFGQEPQAYLDEMFKELPKVPLRKKGLVFYMVFGISSGVSLFSTLTQKVPSINVLTILLNACISMLVVYGVFKFLEKMTFSMKKGSKIKEYLATFVIGVLVTLLFVGSFILGNQFLSFSIPVVLANAIVIVAMLVVSFLLIKKKQKMYYSYILFGWFLVLITMIGRLEITQQLFKSKFMVILTVVLILGASVLASWHSTKVMLKE